MYVCVIYLRDGSHFLIMSHVPELELPGGLMSVQQNGRNFNASFREYDVRAVLIAQTDRPVSRLPGRHDVHRRHGHAHGHDARVVGPQMVRVVHPDARVVHH